MAKTIKVMALTNQQLLISEIEEVAAIDIGQPDCKLINPFVIITESGQTVLEPWLFNITRDPNTLASVQVTIDSTVLGGGGF